MKIITLCGSTKFRKEFEKEQSRLTLEGNIVLSVGLFGHETGLDMNGKTKKMLDRMHFEKIDMSDEIFVINPGGYIGLSTCDEIHYAIAQGKEISFYESAGICWAQIESVQSIAYCKCLNFETHSDYWKCKDCGKEISRYGK